MVKLEATGNFSCENQHGFSCTGEALYDENDGRRLCVLHFPGDDKDEPFGLAIQRKLDQKNYDFRAVWFPDRFSFAGQRFDGAVDFSHATFGNADFSGAVFAESALFFDTSFGRDEGVTWIDFSGPTFDAIVFNGVKAPGRAHVNFVGTRFQGSAGFYEFRVSSANFDNATFERHVRFRSPEFVQRVNFTEATFRKGLRFTYGHRQRRRPAEVMSFWDCEFEQPGRVVFSSTVLRPEWFVCVDAAKFQFRDVEWEPLDVLRATEYVSASLDRANVPIPDILGAAYRSLATNAEDAQRYDEASIFRYAAQDTLRRARWRGRAFWEVRWWYWVASGYGERAWQAMTILVTLWIVCAFLYSATFASLSPRLAHFIDFMPAEQSPIDAKRVVNAPGNAPLPLARALTYSLEVMALQKPSPLPATPAAHALVMLQIVLGPLETALLALAVRRKVSAR